VKQSIEQIGRDFRKELQGITSLKELDALKIKYLGKKGLIAEEMKNLRDVSAEEKPHVGKYINDLKVEAQTAIDAAHEKILLQEETISLQKEFIDISLPARKRAVGSKHPVNQVIDEMVDILISMGFSVWESPEIDKEQYNFDLLNFAQDHPAKDMQDTFYLRPGVLLRTQTTNFQGHVLERVQPPVRVICPGRVYRNEEVSARSHVFFHQIDGLYVDEGVSFQDLILTLSEFVKKLFRKELKMRFRPSFFPFVEPGTEVDIGCLLCDSTGCSVCKYSGWLEILGAGMVHPQVLRNVGVDPEKYTGYAWGMGVERLALLRYGIPDIRLLAENDLRMLKQFPSL
jgi:phenylalanyl-tRNA synthetase alpha chain